VRTALALLLTLLPLAAQRQPVLVELFTSEGCSSCPPADALLLRLEKQPISGAEVIVLSEHVDYWNQLGWTDPFSSAEFSRRQSRYSDVFRRDGVYTPQMVVDGGVEFNGSDARRAQQAIISAAKEKKAAVRVTPQGDHLHVEVSDLPPGAGDRAEVLLAITETNLRSDVRRGENSGRNLEHTGVTRRLEVIGTAKPGAGFSADPKLVLGKNWKRADLRAVVFVQDATTRKVLGVAAVGLSTTDEHR
jgi:hypothetical protein